MPDNMPDSMPDNMPDNMPDTQQNEAHPQNNSLAKHVAGSTSVTVGNKGVIGNKDVIDAQHVVSNFLRILFAQFFTKL
ncbi:MAG: hypothetical protein KJO24_06695, partial [Gammaproteobacteria bacterium]|nr:hypothetical protein [Gammaproteobacteria bacterium]